MIRFCKLLGVPLDAFATTIGEPEFLNSVAFERILRKFIEIAGKPFGSAVDSVKELTAKDFETLSNLRDAAPTVRNKMADAHRNILEFRALKKTITREMKVDREGNKVSPAVVFKRVESSPLRVFPVSPLDLRARLAPPETPEPTRSTRSETHPDPDAQETPPTTRPREKGLSAIEEIEVLTDSGGDIDDIPFKRRPNRKIGSGTVKQVTEITRVVEAQTSAGYFIQRDDAVIISSIPRPGNPTNSVSSQSYSSLSAPAVPPNLMSLIIPQPQPSTHASTQSNNSIPLNQMTLVSYPIPPPAPVPPPSVPLPPPVSTPPPSQLPTSGSILPRPLASPVGTDGPCNSSKKPLWKGDYDDPWILSVVARLRSSQEREYAETLRQLTAPSEETTKQRFFNILKAFAARETKRKSVVLAKAILAFLPSKARSFVLLVLESGTLGRGRLNVIVKLQFFFVSSVIIYDDLFTDHPDRATLATAVMNFPVGVIVDNLKFLAANSRRPNIIVDKMRRADCFRGNYLADFDQWKESRVKSFIEFICDKIGIPVPDEARFLSLRVDLDRELANFFKGETEVPDFFQICVKLTCNSDESFRECIDYLAEKSNPLCEFVSEMRGVPFLNNPAASNFIPSCATPFNVSLHELACGSNTFINDEFSVREFQANVDSARHFAVLIRCGSTFGEIASFRFRQPAFHYAQHHSRHQRPGVVSALGRVAREKQVFVFKKDLVADFFETEFGLAPGNLTDACELAKKYEGVQPAIASLARHISGGDYCRRGRNFVHFSLPSPAAIQHLDVDVSVLYEFCIKALGLMSFEMKDDQFVPRRSEKRKRSDDGNSRSRSRKR